MTLQARALLSVLGAVTALLPAATRAQDSQAWMPIAGIEEVSYVGAEDLTRDVRDGSALLQLANAVRIDGQSWDGVLVGEGFLHFMRLPEGRLPDQFDREDPALGGRAPALPELGPRIDVFAGGRAQVARGGQVLGIVDGDRLAIRWTALSAPPSRGFAIVEALVAPDDVRVQYLHVPRELTSGALMSRLSATSYRLLGGGGEVILTPTIPPDMPMSSLPPPAGCDPAPGTWCQYTGPGCASTTPCSTRVEDNWRFGEGGFCEGCPYLFYVLVECGTEMHFPMTDMEALDLTITNMVTGLRPDLRCINETALGTPPPWVGGPFCGPGQPGPWWSPPLDVTNNAGQGHVIAEDVNLDGDCTTRFDIGCADLPPSGPAPTVVYGEEQVIDCYVTDLTGLCGIYKFEMLSGGNVWELFSNCDGTDTPQFDIYFDCTEAWAAYNPLPELGIANATTTGDCWTYNVSFDVQNIGCVDEPGDVPVRIQSTCGDVLDVVVPGPIPAHGTAPYTQVMTLSCPQSTLTLTVDPSNSVVECTESATAAACAAAAGQDQITVGTTCCPLLDAGAPKTTCADDPIALSDASSQFADAFLWSDGGAGGTFSPSATVRNPSYLPPPGFAGPITLTLIVTFTQSGCSRVDTLPLTVSPLPIPEAGADKTACVGDAVTLDDATVPGADVFAWSDASAGGVFTPSASVLNPTYLNSTPGLHVLTLQATASLGGCTASDAVVVEIIAAPALTAGSDIEICEDADAAISTASAGTAHALTWSDGGAGGAFVPSTHVVDPTYEPPGPGFYTLTLTGTETHVGAYASGTPIYTADMQGAIGPEWSSTVTELTPAGGRRILGRFTNGAVTLSLSGLPTHGELSVCFDLIVAGTWDGHAQVDPAVGPDLWNLDVVGGATLLHVSFAQALPRLQSYPEPYVDALGTASPAHPPRTGAAETDTLGYAGGDSVYRLSFTFAHSAPTVTLRFAGSGLGGLADESWGLDDVFVGTEPCVGCTTIDSLELTVHELPGADAGPDSGACIGEAVPLLEALAGSADTFSWSDSGAGGTFTPSPNVLNPTYEHPSVGTFTLTLTATATSTGCTNVDTTDVTFGQAPLVDAGPQLQACAGDAATITGATSTADTYSWTDGGAGGSFSPNSHVLSPSYTHQQAGIYTLTLEVTDSLTQCSAEDSTQVQVNANPLVEAGTNKVGCADAPIALDDAFAALGTSITWSDGAGNGSFTPSPNVLEPAYSNPTAGTYTLTVVVTRPSTGCTSTDSLQVTVNANPAVNAGADKATCAGVAVALADATAAPGTRSWSDGGSGGVFLPSPTVLNPSYRNDTPGVRTLTLTVQSAQGCTRQDSLVATVSPNPTVNAGLDKEACVSQPVALADATSSGNTFAWSDGGAGGSFAPSVFVRNPSYQNPVRGTYTLTLVASTAGTGCQASDSVLVMVRALPVAAFTELGAPHCEDEPVCFSNTSTDGTSWSWSFGAGGNSTEMAPCFTYSNPGTFNVQLTAFNVCGQATTSHQVTIAAKPVANFSFSTQGNSFCKNKDVNFNDLSTGSPTSWQWDFGDGGTSTAQNPVHQFAIDGLFIVTLRACNSCGCGPPTFQAVEIAASCQTNCEANSNQIACQGGGATINSNTCTAHGNFNTSSYPCSPDGIVYSGENQTWDLNFVAGSNFIVTLVETTPEPNGYDLDLMISDACNPPNCVAWGDTQVAYDDRTPANDDFWLIVDGRNGTCGPYQLQVQCLSPAATAQCGAPVFPGILAADDLDPCGIPGVLVTWPAVTDWGNQTNGTDCATGTFEIWRAPADDPTDEVRIGTAGSTSTSFTDVNAVPRESFLYRVHAINTCCASPTITVPTNEGTDDFANTIEVNAGGGSTVTCLQPVAQLLGSASGGSGAGFDFHWTPEAGLSDPDIPNPTTTQGGLYTLTATDLGDGCAMADSVAIVFDAQLPTASAGPDRELTCTTTSVTLQGSVSGGNATAGYSYSWSPAGLVSSPSAPAPTTATPGTYTLTVVALATGCTDTDTVVVGSSVGVPVANAGTNRELTCAAASVTLDGSASGGDGSEGFLFAWSPAAGLDDPTSPTPEASQPGTYTLTVTDVHSGCTDTDSVVVGVNEDPPVAGAGPDRGLACNGSPVGLDGSALGGDGSDGYAFAWAPAEAVSDPTAEDPTTTVAGTFTLTVTDVHTGCTASDVVTVAVAPNAPVAAAGPDREITCLTTIVALQGSASGGDGSQGYTFAWAPAGLVSDPAAPSPTTSTPGPYTLTVTSIADGCSGTDAVLVRDLTVPHVADAGPSRVISCAQGTATLQGSVSGGDGRNGFAFEWQPTGPLSDPNAPSPTTSAPGTYTVTVTDLYTGCTDSDTVVVSQDQAAPLAEAGPAKTLSCAVTAVTLDGSASGGNGTGGYSFAWSPAGAVSNASSPTPTTSTPGTYTLTVVDLANGCADTDTVSVGQDVAPPLANAGSDALLVCSGPGVTLSGGASGGNGSSGYTFHWEPAGAVSNPATASTQALAAGTFTLTVTSVANGCASNDTVLVTSANAPVADAGPADSVACNATTASLQGSVSGGNGSQGFTAQWTPTAGVGNPAALVTTTTQPGTYTLVVTDVATGCKATDSVVIANDLVPPSVEAGPVATVTCGDPQVTLQGSASGGNGSQGYSFSWSPAAQVSNPTAAQPTTSIPGTYTLVVTSVATGCTAQDTVEVLDGTEAPLSSAGPDQVRDCSFPVAQLAGAAAGGDGSAGYTFAWSPAAALSNPTAASPTTSQAGTYTLTVTDLATGCTDTDTVVVTNDFAAPVTSAGDDKVIDCDDPIVQLDGSASGGNGSRGYTFAWEPAGDVSNPISSTPVALAPGTFTLTVTDRANGCTATDIVVVVDDLEPPVATAGPDQTLDCNTTVVTLTGGASGGNGSLGYSFAWEPSVDVASPDTAITDTNTPGVYSLTVTDLATGCTSTDTVSVPQDLRLPLANAGPDRQLNCASPVVTLAGTASAGDASQGYTFHWEPAGQVSDANVAQPTTIQTGVYTLTVTSVGNACVDTDTVVVTQGAGPPVANAGPDKAIDCDTTQVTLQGSGTGGNGTQGYTFAWSPAGQVSSPTAAQPTTTTPGTYTVVVTSVANGCTAADTVTVLDARIPPVSAAGPDLLLDCDSSVVTLLGSASGGDGSLGYAFAWAPAGAVSNANIPQPTTNAPGTYTLTVTALATACVSVDTVVVTRDEERPVAFAGPDRALDCLTTQVTLAGSATDGNDSAGYLWAWTPAASVSNPAGQAPTTTQPGTYTLTVTAVATGCTDTDTVVVTLDDAAPTADAGPSQVIDCLQPVVTLLGAASGGNGAMGYAYSWTPAASVSNPSAAEPTTDEPGTYTLTVTDLANGCTDSSAVVITQDVAAPVANAGADVVLGCSEPSVALSGSASGGNGTAGYAFRWEPAGATTDPDVAATSATASGTFTLTVTDLANGCASTDQVVVASGSLPPIANAGPDDAISCIDGVAALAGSASGGDGSLGYETTWSPTAGVANPDVAQTTTTEPGLYSLVVMDLATGCRSVDSAEVIDDRNNPEADAGPLRVITCASSAVTLLGSASGGNGTLGYSYAWQPAGQVSNASAQQPTTSTPGTYTVMVTDLANGCTDEDQVTVALDTTPPVAQAGLDLVLGCNGDVTLQGAASGGNGSLGYTFSWSPAGGVSDPNAAQPLTTTPGTYTLTVTDVANGCSHVDSVLVIDDATPPIADAGPDGEVSCTEPGFQLLGVASGGNGSAGYAYAWEPPDAVSDATAAQPLATVAGTFTLTVTDLANGCTATDTVQVSADLDAPVASAGADAVLDCQDPSVPLSGSASAGSGSYSFHWEPVSAVTDPDSAATGATAAGTFTLTVTDLANGCTDTDTAVVTLSEPPPIANAGPDDIISCEQGAASLLGSASGGDGRLGYTAQWSPTAGVANPTAFATTTIVGAVYTLTITDVFTGCRSFDTVTILEESVPPIADAGPDSTITCVTPPATLAGNASGGNGSLGYTYRWAPTAGVANPNAQVTTTTIGATYTLTVTDEFTGCTDTDTVVVVGDNVLPTVSAGPDKALTCIESDVTLSGSASGGNSSAGYSFSWTPAADLLFPNSPDPITSTPGTYTLTVVALATGCQRTDTVRVTSNTNPPAANAGPDRVLTCDAPTVVLQGGPSGGNFTYLWSPAGQVSDPTTRNPTTSLPGTYTLRVTSRVNGCSATDIVVVTDQRTPPTANAGPDKIITCGTPSVVLEGSGAGAFGAAAFSWQPAGLVSNPTIAQPTVATAGTFTLTVRDVSTGCTATDTVVVTSAAVIPTANAGPDKRIDCARAEVMLDGSASGGSGAGFSFAWTPAAGLSDPESATPLASAPANYLLTVTDLGNGCVASDTVSVTIEVAAPTADAGGDAVLPCSQPSVTLSGAASGGNGGAGYSFHWEPAGAVSNPDAPTTQAQASGTFILTVTDRVNGCTGRDEVVVTSPGAAVVSAGPDSGLRCSDGLADLRGTVVGGDPSGGRTVNWSPANGLADPTALVTTTTLPGTYTLLVVDLATGCRSAAAVTIAEEAPRPVISAGPDSSLTCVTSVVTLQGSATGGDGSLGYTFAWSPAADVSDPTAQAPTTILPGTYTLTVMDVATGCSITDEVVVGVAQTAPVAAAGPDVVIACAVPAPLLQGSASGGDGSLGYTFAWSPTAGLTDPTSPTPGATRPGTYTLTVTDVFSGCTATDTVDVTRAPGLPQVNAGADRTLDCTTLTATLTGSVTGGNGTQGFRFAWTPAADVTNPASPTTSTSVPGTYTLTVTDVATGCIAVDTVVVTQVVPPTPAEPSALDVDPGVEPLRVTWADRALGRLRVAWEPLPAGIEGRVYQGTLTALHATGYDHGRLACDLPTAEHVFVPIAGQLYFLATTANCAGAESSYGRSSLGVERPNAATASGNPCP